MFFLRIVMMALHGLRANLLRSLLATLGVIIGVAAVISAMSILEGATRDITDRFESLGSELISIYGGQARVHTYSIYREVDRVRSRASVRLLERGAKRALAGTAGAHAV